MRVPALLLLLVSFALPAAASESRDARECRYRPSFNCAQADDATSRLICTNPALLRADCALGHAYRDARALPGGDSHDRRLRQDQRKWLDARDDACAKRKGQGLVECLKTQTERRTRQLIERYKLPVAGKAYQTDGGPKKD